jgi:hypothetical protein
MEALGGRGGISPLILSSHLNLHFPSGLFPSDFQTKFCEETFAVMLDISYYLFLIIFAYRNISTYASLNTLW